MTQKFLEQERKDLNLHIDLCAQRYHELDNRLAVVERKIDQLSEDLARGQRSLQKTIIATAATIVPSVLALIVTMLTTI